MPSKKRVVNAEADKQPLFDGGTVAAALTSEMRDWLDSHCKHIDRPQAWVFRKALDLYRNNAAV